MVTNKHFLLIKQHAVHVFNSLRSCLAGLIVHEAIALRVSELILCNLATKDVPKSCKCVVQRFIVYCRIKVFDEHVSLTSFAQSRVALRPHNTARTAFDNRIVELFQRALSICCIIVVYIGVAKGATSNGVTTDTDRCYLSH